MYSIGTVVNCFEYFYKTIHSTLIEALKNSQYFCVYYESNIYEDILGLENHEEVYIIMSKIWDE